MKSKKELTMKDNVIKRTEELIKAAYGETIQLSESVKVLKIDETYRATPKMAMQSIEKTINRKFTIEEVGWFYHLMHLTVDGIEERTHTLLYDQILFRVIFNSELTTVIYRI